MSAITAIPGSPGKPGFGFLGWDSGDLFVFLRVLCGKSDGFPGFPDHGDHPIT
jgi:hypothetical protein